MKAKIVTQDAEVILDGKRFMLESGDKVIIEAMPGTTPPTEIGVMTHASAPESSATQPAPGFQPNTTPKHLSGTPAALAWMKSNGITPTNLQQTPQFKFPLGAVLDDIHYPGEGYGEVIVGYGVGRPAAEAAARGRYESPRINKPVYITGVIGNADEVDGFDEIGDCERDLELVGMDESVMPNLMPPPAVETTDAAQSTCKVCGKKFLGRSERARCADCMASQHAAAERATGVQ